MTRTLDRIGLSLLILLTVWLTIGDSHAQTSVEVFPPWSGSYIANTWVVPVVAGKPGLAAVPNRYLLMNPANQVVGELADKTMAANALYAGDVLTAVRALMAATVTGTAPPGAINEFRTRVGPLLTAIDAAAK